MEVAVKVLTLQEGDTANRKREDFLREANIFRTLHHPNIMQVGNSMTHSLYHTVYRTIYQVFGIVINEDPYMMVMELLEKENLKDYLRQVGKDLFEFELLSICKDVSVPSIICFVVTLHVPEHSLRLCR